MVTGAAGFIGTHLVTALISAGCEPVLLTRSQGEESLPEFGKGVRWVHGDLTDPNTISDLIQREKPATIFHLAGTRGRGDVYRGGEACKELNFHATVRVLDAAMKARVRRIVIAGSAEEYGNQSGPLRESLTSRATSPYGISKAMATNYAKTAHAQNKCPVVVVRPFSVYGPGQPSDMFVAEAVDSAVRNVEFKMSRGEQKRDLIFVDDAARGFIQAACAENVEGHVINLGTGQAHRLRDVAELTWKMADATAALLIGARDASEDELYDTWADITLARLLLDWAPRVDLATGLRQTIRFAKERRSCSKAS